MEKAPTRAFFWLKAPTSAFTFKTLLRHYAIWALSTNLDAYVSHMLVRSVHSYIPDQAAVSCDPPITRLSVSSLRLDIWARAILGRWQLCGAMAVLNLSFPFICFFLNIFGTPQSSVNLYLCNLYLPRRLVLQRAAGAEHWSTSSHHREADKTICSCPPPPGPML